MPGEYILSVPQIAAALGVSERSLWRWTGSAPRYRPARENEPHLFPLPAVVTALRSPGGRKRGLSATEGAELARVAVLPARACPASLPVGDPDTFLAVLTPAEAERARTLIGQARTGLVRAAWSAVTPELEAAAAKIVLHPAVACAVLGCPDALPSSDAWQFFATAFCITNANKETAHV